MTAIEFRVLGTPAPQGSKNAIPLAKKVNGKTVFTGKVALVESSKAVKPWRAAVVEEARKHVTVKLTGPVELGAHFYLARPRKHYRTGKHAHLLRDSAPEWPMVKPDTDKLLRATMDALTTAGAYTDDALVVRTHSTKRYATPTQPPGAMIRVRPVPGRGDTE